MTDEREQDERVSRRNRRAKLAGRAKRDKFVQGTRSYLHAMTNSRAKRIAEKTEERREE